MESATHSLAGRQLVTAGLPSAASTVLAQDAVQIEGMNATTENTLRLARRVLDYEANSLFSFHNEALHQEHNAKQAELYARMYNNLVCLRQYLTEDGLKRIADWTGPEALEIIPVSI